MNSGLRDIVPLNIPPGATQSYQPPGWYLGPDGNWYWTGDNPPDLNIPITTGPGIPSNAGWVASPVATTSATGLVSPAGTVVWTGPGKPSVLPGSLVPPQTVVQLPPSAQGPLMNWTPQPSLPDSFLPPTLQRSNPLVAPADWVPNRFDFQILGRAKKWQWVAAHGGLKTCCRIPELGSPVYDDPPWEVMPSNAFEFNEMNGLPVTEFQTAGAYNGLDVQILSIQVPAGYDGVINRLVASTEGLTGYNDFVGAISWRLQYGVRYAKNLGNLDNTFGSFTNALQVPGRNIARVIAGQTIQVFASVPPDSPISTAGGTINAGIFGWFYPRR